MKTLNRINLLFTCLLAISLMTYPLSEKNQFFGNLFGYALFSLIPYGLFQVLLSIILKLNGYGKNFSLYHKLLILYSSIFIIVSLFESFHNYVNYFTFFLIPFACAITFTYQLNKIS